MWMVFAWLTVLAWGTSETIFKRSSDGDNQSVARLLAYNGVIFGLSGVVYMLVVYKGFNFDPRKILTYLPVAGTYILSMFSYYHAMSRVKISIISPIVNSSCALTILLSVIYLGQRPGVIQITAMSVILVSIIGLSLYGDGSGNERAAGKKTKFSAFALGLIFALGYFALDGLASFGDAYMLDGSLSEDDTLVSHALISLAVGLACHVYLRIKDKNYRFKPDKMKLVGAAFETAGEYTYIYAMGAGMSSVVSPFVASYSAVTIILSRVFLKEKLNKIQYMFVLLIMAGIVALSFE